MCLLIRYPALLRWTWWGWIHLYTLVLNSLVFMQICRNMDMAWLIQLGGTGPIYPMPPSSLCNVYTVLMLKCQIASGLLWALMRDRLSQLPWSKFYTMNLGLFRALGMWNLGACVYFACCDFVSIPFNLFFFFLPSHHSHYNSMYKNN